MLELIVVAFFQAPGGDFSGHPAPPFRQEMVNQGSNVHGGIGANPHYANRCSNRRTGSRIVRQRCPRPEEAAAREAEAAAAAAAAATAEAAPEQNTTAPPNE